MSNKVYQCIRLFFGGLICGISISNSYLIPLFLVGHYFLIKGLISRNVLLFNFIPGWLFGFGFFITSMHWIINPFLIYEEHKHFAPFIIFIFPFFMGLFFALPSFLITLFFNFKRDKETLFTLSFFIALFLFSSEVLRSKIFGGLPLNLYAHIWIFDENFFQIVSFVGVYGLSFLTIFWIVISILLIIRKRVSFLTSLIIFPLFLWTFSFLHKKENLSIKDTLAIRVVQPNILQKEKWDKSLFQQHVDKLLRLSVKDEKTQLVVIWPEAAMTVYLNENNDLLNYIRSNIDDYTTIITGGLRRVFENNSFKIYNSLFVIQKNSFTFYDKKHLVPFGEFIPLRSLLNFWKITPGKTDFSSGNKENLIALENNEKKITFEPSICYEAIFQTFNYRKIGLLINITNDAWFGKTSGPKQHLTASIFRSVEKGVPLLRSANSGISVITDSNGKILKKIELDRVGFIEKKIILGENSTFFMKYKSKVVLILISIFFFLNLSIDFVIKKRKSLKIF